MIYLATATDVDPDIVAAIRERIAREFGVETRGMELPRLDFAWDERRNQYSSIAVMEMLLRECPPDGGKVLGLTRVDLFIPVLTFVYGQAQLNGRAGVVSLARLQQEFYGLPADREIFRERALKEALHEAGHMWGLVHCVSTECAMSLSTHIRHIDAKRAGYCAACMARLARERNR